MDRPERHEMKGMLTLELRDIAGRVLETRSVQNQITDEGRKLVADLFAGALVGTPKLRIAVGEGGGEVLVSDTALTDAVEAEATATAQKNEVTVKATLEATLTGDTKPIQEAGIIVEVGGRRALYNRVTFAVLHKGPQMALALGWKVVF